MLVTSWYVDSDVGGTVKFVDLVKIIKIRHQRECKARYLWCQVGDKVRML